MPTSIKPGSEYRIKIISASNSAEYDFSDNYFTIKPPQVLYPSAPGITVRRGDTVNITWEAFTGASVKIHLYQASTYLTRVTPFDLTSNNGLYSWVVPASLKAGTTYRIKIISATNSADYDFSDNFFTIQ